MDILSGGYAARGICLLLVVPLQRLLMRLRRGDCAGVGGRAPPAQTPEGVGRRRSSASFSLRSGLTLRVRCAHGLRSVASAADHRDDFQPFLTLHGARHQMLSRSVRPAPAVSVSVRCSASEDSGEASRWPSRKGAASLGRSPRRSVGAAPGKERERYSLAARRGAPVLRTLYKGETLIQC